MRVNGDPMWRRLQSDKSADSEIACSRRSDSGARAKNKASLPSFFPALSLALFFARPPLSERLEQANSEKSVTASQIFGCRARF